MKDLATIQKELASVQKLLEEYRLDQLKMANRGKSLLALPMILFVACIIGMAVFYPDYTLLFLIGMGLCAAATVWLYFNAYLKYIQNYQHKFKSTLLEKIVHSVKPDMSYAPTKYISEAEFDASGLFDTEAYEGYGGEDLFEGTIGGLPVRFSEIVAKNLSGKNTVDLFNGIFMIVDVKTSFKGKTFVLPEKSENFIDRFNKNIQGHTDRGELMNMEHQEKFERYFAIYTDTPDEAKRILSDDMLEGILEVRKTFNSDISMSFQDRKGLVYIAVAIGSRNLLEPNINESLSKDNKVVDRICAELMTCFEIVKELPLNFEQ
ncbi:MAG: DUF3137 domain-containing protein [Aureispira sp.]|nr:DUF3137 domain-containing protein [Aureispira sp.]